MFGALKHKQHTQMEQPLLNAVLPCTLVHKQLREGVPHAERYQFYVQFDSSAAVGGALDGLPNVAVTEALFVMMPVVTRMQCTVNPSRTVLQTITPLPMMSALASPVPEPAVTSTSVSVSQ